MTDRPILFSTPMVRGLLDDRKTQTRRIMKPQPEHLQLYDWKGKRLHDSEYRHWCWNGHVGDDNWDDITTQLKPFLRHQIGDRLWVRETWAERVKGEAATYRADVPELPIQWKPSIFMPRWASRITLIVTDVRVERLQDISQEDAEEEGVEVASSDPEWFGYRDYGNNSVMNPTPRGSYRTLWDSINGSGAWDTNPWVVAITFEILKQNIDEVA